MKLNDSVYELYRPSEGTPSLDVVFFHGFQHGNYEKAHLFTWLSGDGTCIWPQVWLKTDFPRARILTVSYNGMLHTINSQPSGDLYPLVENLLSDLLLQNIGQEPRCPVVLVGQSFGGLLIKMLCVLASSRAGRSNGKEDLFLNNLKGVLFYSTPHNGISDSFVSSKPELLRSPLLPYLKVDSAERSRLQMDFNGLWTERTCKMKALGESVTSTWGTFDGLVVPESSSRYGIGFLVERAADHISISRPPTKTSRRFTHLKELLNDIVGDSNKEHPENFQELPKESETGIQGLEDFTKMLEETTRLGLYGMVGIGKTTLVKALFNNVEGSFDYTCFIKQDEILVKDIILRNMHHRGKLVTENGRLRSRITGRKLLLVLDGVTSKKDFDIAESFMCDVDRASRFVATSRNKELFASKGFTLHPIGFLCPPSSRELFLRYASPDGRSVPFPSQVDGIVEKCDKLPLTLEIVGECLSAKLVESDWQLILRALDEAKDIYVLGRLWAKLKISYDSLNEKEKILFLDAATVFYKYDLSVAMAAWTYLDGYQSYHWQQLVNFSLVWEDPDGERTRIGMQKQLLSMGRMIALTRKENYSIEDGYRIWNNYDRAFKLLLKKHNIIDEEYMKDIIALKSIRTEITQEVIDSALDTDLGCRTDIPICGSELSKMTKLKYLWLDGFHIDQRQDSPLPSRIVYLHLSHMSFSAFPFSPCRYECMIILSLNEIVGIGSIPTNFGRLQSLQILRIENNDSLEGLPDSIRNLAKLKYLSINCRKLIRLPSRLGDLKALETLRICSCNSLLALPESIGSLQTLKVVEIMECVWESLPDTLGSLSKLKHLRIERCPDLKSLPDTLGELKAFETLTIVCCNSLSGLPNSLGCLSNLKVIRIRSCNSLKKLPREFEEQRALEHIELNEIWLQSVPNLEMITSLKTLRLSWGRTSTFPRLPECLVGHVTEENYTSPLTFNVENRIFRADPAGNSQDVPIGIVGTLEGI